MNCDQEQPNIIPVEPQCNSGRCFPLSNFCHPQQQIPQTAGGCAPGKLLFPYWQAAEHSYRERGKFLN
jgi:hypothetical protein